MDGLFFRLQIAFPWKLPKASVRGNHQSDGRMIMDYLIRSDFGCLRKRNLIIKPGRFYHPLLLFFHMSYRAVDHITHAVDHADFYTDIVA